MIEKVFKYLRDNPGYVSCRKIAEEVLAIKPANGSLAARLVDSLLAADGRFETDGQGNWRLKSSGSPSGCEDALSGATLNLICVETSRGNSPAKAIAAIAAAKLRGCEVADRFAACVSPPAGQLLDFNSAVELIGEDEPLIAPKPQALCRLLDFCSGASILTFDSGDSSLLERELASAGMQKPQWLTLSLKAICERLLPERRLKTIDDLAQAFGLPYAGAASLKAKLRLLAEVAREALLLATELGYESLSELAELQEAEVSDLDFSRYSFDRRFLASLPVSAGVYLMRDRGGRIIYVGKAKNLRSRVSSYFYSRGESPEKLAALHASLYDIDYQVTGSELEALLLEAKLIKELKPPLNRQVEVHARPTSRTKDRRLIVLLPGADDDSVALFLLGGRNGVSSLAARRDLRDFAKVGRRIRGAFFSQSQARSGKEPSWQLELARWWVERNYDVTNIIDVDAAGSLRNCLRLLEGYIREFEPPKVIRW